MIGEVVVQRSARGLLVQEGKLVLIKRTRPGRSPYFVAPGGKVEDSDPSVAAALRREVREELGGTIGIPTQVLLITDVLGIGSEGVRRLGVQHFFAAALLGYDLSARAGREFTRPHPPPPRTNEKVHQHQDPDELAAVDLKPPRLAGYLAANLTAVTAEATRAGSARHDERMLR
ncbi:NUDIX domain-containing protein [Actinomadura harenae]|uniref:NUDIX domain-containing protein n=1 Tax=Actinomadura harenae TaxID=2483351 RepID=UPI0018F79DE6|nr:NUDIX domain-containing protein [Actinomadura harenae]